jgi:hypothetical protein
MANFMLIVVDALRADHLGFYTGEDTGTPNLDELARQGVFFQNAISQASWTRPAVCSLLTGLYPSQHGVGDRMKQQQESLSVIALDPAIPTLAETLSGNRYETAAFMGGNANLKPLFGITRGFAHYAWRPTVDGSVIVEDFDRWLGVDRPRDAFCYLHFMDVHHPLPMENVSSRLDGGLNLEAVTASMEELVSHYAAAVRRVDDYVGRIVQGLKSVGKFDDTWIFVTADHGEELMDHGKMLSHGRTLYRELIHVPLIVKPPRGVPAGRIVGAPVQLIDIMPTILECAGLPREDLAGRSLLPSIRGEEPDAPSHAFSELLRWQQYVQSVTTATHQFIQTYLFEEPREASPADLREGSSAVFMGQPIHNGPFLATRASLKSGDASTMRGMVDHIDLEDSTITVMGVTFHLDESTELVGHDKKPIDFHEFAVGSKVSLNFTTHPHGQRVASKIEQRKPGGKSKIGGVMEEVRVLEDGLRSVIVLGTEILVDRDLPVSPVREKKDLQGRTEKRANALPRILIGDFIEAQRELYDITDDPQETRNIVDERPDIAQELEETLVIWTESLVSGGRYGAPGSVDVDPETMEQLRRMGYIE